MKILITESQLRTIISEQPESRFGPEQFMSQSERRAMQSGNPQQAGDALMSGAQKQMDYVHSIDIHSLLLTAEIVSVFIPVVGPGIAAALGLADSALHFKKGNKKQGTISLVLALLPGIGSVVSKIPGVKTLGTKGMTVLADKVTQGITKLTPIESQVIRGINLNKNLIHSEVDGLIKRISTNLANKTVKKSINPVVSNAASVADNYIFNKSVQNATDMSYDLVTKK